MVLRDLCAIVVIYVVGDILNRKDDVDQLYFLPPFSKCHIIIFVGVDKVECPIVNV